MVERGLVERFFPGADAGEGPPRPPPRVVESWRLLEGGYVHDEHVGFTRMGRDAASSRCRQHCHSYVPGLAVREFWDVDDPGLRRRAGGGKSSKAESSTSSAAATWCRYLESKYPQIRSEFDRVTADLDQLAARGNNVWAGALTDDASGYGEGWRTLVLMDRGRWDPVNANLFPVASRAVRDSGAPAVEVFFASMRPNSRIEPHTDFTNFVLTSHLALDIPGSGENKCRITVGDETREWINGRVMVLDTSLLHDAANDSDRTRYILMLRVWHPDLTQTEREALQFTYDCLEIPELATGGPTERREAQELAEKLRSFPEISGGAPAARQGFGGAPASRGKRNKGRRQ
jgi:aspartate beta-hydroxylase